jgi:hypothetical protein
MKPKQPAGPAHELGNMRELGVNNLLASCLTDVCRYTALIDVSNYPADTEARRNAACLAIPRGATPDSIRGRS